MENQEPYIVCASCRKKVFKSEIDNGAEVSYIPVSPGSSGDFVIFQGFIHAYSGDGEQLFRRMANTCKP